MPQVVLPTALPQLYTAMFLLWFTFGCPQQPQPPHQHKELQGITPVLHRGRNRLPRSTAVLWVNHHQHPVCSKVGGEAQPTSVPTAQLPGGSMRGSGPPPPAGSSPFTAQLCPIHRAFAFPLSQTAGALPAATRQSRSARPQHGDAVEISAFS